MLGYLMKRITPLEYGFIMEISGTKPKLDLIERISYASIHPFFKSEKFRNALILYRRYGLRPPVTALPKKTAYSEVSAVRLKKMYESEMIRAYGNPE